MTQGERSTWRDALRGNVWALGVVSLWTDFASEMLNPLLPVFIAGLVPAGWAAFWLGLTEGLAEATASLLKLVSGRLSDRLGRRKALVLVGYGLSNLVRPAMASCLVVWQVTALKFLDRVGKGVRTAPRDALIGDSVVADRRGLAFSFHRALDHLGAVLGPLTAGLLLLGLLGAAGAGMGTAGGTPGPEEMRALRWVFGLALVPGLLALGFLAFGVREVAPAPQAGTGRGAGGRLPGRLWVTVGAVTLFALGNSSDLFLLLYGRERFGLGLLELIGLWIGLHLSKIAFSLPGGALSDRLGRRPVIVAGWLVYAGVYLGMAAAGQTWQYAALFVAYGLYYGLTEGAEKALVLDLAPAGRVASAFGLYHGAVGLAALPASLLFGVFWLQLGPQLAFGIGAGLALLATGWLLVIPRGKPVHQTPGAPFR